MGDDARDAPKHLDPRALWDPAVRRWRAASLALLVAGCDGAMAGDAGAVIEDAAGADAGGDAGAPPDAGSSDAGEEDAAMPGPVATVLTLNLHCLSIDGTAYGSNDARFAAIAETVAREGVDVLLLQEVCDDGALDAGAALGAALSAAGAGDFQIHAAFAHVAWEGTPDEARESVAVMARALASPSTLDHRVQDGLRRVAASATVETALGPLRATSLHLDHRSAPARLAQAREAGAISLSEAYDGALPSVIGGDLNAPRGSDAHGAFGALGYLDASDAAGGDRIDHVFVHRSAPLRAVEARRVLDDAATRVSDHPGVLVRLVAAAPADVTWTRVIAAYDAGVGRHLWIRGSAAPLSWDAGWPMHALAPGRWRFVTSELAGRVEVKTLIDDTLWQTGENDVVMAGGETTITPAF